MSGELSSVLTQNFGELSEWIQATMPQYVEANIQCYSIGLYASIAITVVSFILFGISFFYHYRKDYKPMYDSISIVTIVMGWISLIIGVVASLLFGYSLHQWCYYPDAAFLHYVIAHL